MKVYPLADPDLRISRTKRREEEVLVRINAAPVITVRVNTLEKVA